MSIAWCVVVGLFGFGTQFGLCLRTPDSDEQEAQLAESWISAAKAYEKVHDEKQTLVFVGGSTRSGTTLLTHFVRIHREQVTTTRTTGARGTLEGDSWQDIAGAVSTMGNYRTCNSVPVRTEADADRLRAKVFAHLAREGQADPTRPVLVHKRPSHAWSARLLQAIFRETHTVRFVFGVKHPSEATGACNPQSRNRKTIIDNWGVCYRKIVDNVLPYLDSYILVRQEDLFLNASAVAKQIEDYIGLDRFTNIKFKGTPSSIASMAKEDFTGGADGDEQQTHCFNCEDVQEFVIDLRYFGHCEAEKQRADTSDPFYDPASARWKFWSRLGYRPDSVRNVGGPLIQLVKSPTATPEIAKGIVVPP
mmetsp:Transcript_53236/g.155029  ORF Transcript_53236/g.155029 Transcript_53236/m.155029 type:complete len:363 (-) Transcript_53236:143-1231(-)